MIVHATEASYRLSHCDHSVQVDHVAVLELAHDGCLLEELDLCTLIRARLECLHCHLHCSHGRQPLPLVHRTKLPRTQVLVNPAKNKQETEMIITSSKSVV